MYSRDPEANQQNSRQEYWEIIGIATWPALRIRPSIHDPKRDFNLRMIFTGSKARKRFHSSLMRT